MFRRSAVNASRLTLRGRVSIAEPLSFRLVVIVLAAAVASALTFANAMSYPQRETVPGFIVVSTGLSSVFAKRDGLVTERFVKVGSVVRQGETLAVLSNESAESELASHTERVRIAERQLDEIRAQLELEESREKTVRRRSIAALAALESRIGRLLAQRAAHARRLELAQRELARMRTLAEQRFTADADVRTRHEAVLALESEAAALDARLAEFRGEHALMQLDIEALGDEHARAISNLRLRQHTLNEALIDRRMAGRELLLAPVAGTVTAVDADVGQRQRADRAAVSIRPREAVFEAHLFAPSRAIGFVRPGDEVRLSVDAFPHQKHGKLRGSVTEIAQSATVPHPRHGIGTGGYRIVVGLHPSSDQATLALAIDMRVQGDLKLGERKPIDWLLDPLRSLRF